MNQQAVGKPVNEKHEPQTASRRRFLTGVLTGGLLGSLLVGSFSVYSHAGHGPGWWSRVGYGGCGFHRHGTYDAESLAQRAEFATDWVMSRINATDDQREQVNTIIQNTVNDLSLVREQHRGHRQALLDALVQPTIDREALGKIRLAELQLAETASSRLVEAIAEVAEVLTPTQRSELIELAARFRR